MTRTDTGRATAEQLALILDTRRAESDDDATATDAEILAHIRNTLTLPGEGAPGGFPVTDDGTAYAAALIAFLTPADKQDADAALAAFLTPTPETLDERAARIELNRRADEEWQALSPAEQAAQIADVERAEDPGGPCDCANCYLSGNADTGDTAPLTPEQEARARDLLGGLLVCNGDGERELDYALGSAERSRVAQAPQKRGVVWGDFAKSLQHPLHVRLVRAREGRKGRDR